MALKLRLPWTTEAETILPKTGDERAADYIMERMKFRTHEDIRTFENAILDAQNIYRPLRWPLHRIYRRIIDDNHLSSQWSTRKLKTAEKQFKIVGADGETEDVEMTKLLEKPWFLSFIDIALDSRAWGFSLIEFGPWDGEKFCPWQKANKKWQDAVEEVDRDNVRPEFGIVGKDWNDITGPSYYEQPFSDWCIFVGSTKSHGFLYKAVKPCLYKDNCLSNWSEWAEIFGTDIRIGKTLSSGPARQTFLDLLKNLGASGYGIIEPNDEIDFKGTSRTDAWQVYQRLNEYVDIGISKLVFGQDVVTNNTGQVVGKVGENVSNLYGDSDAKWMATVINESLFPLMIDKGVTGLTGKIFKWDVTEKVMLPERAKIDLAISQMGFSIDPDYIQETYGTPVEVKEDPAQAAQGSAKVLKAIQNLYEFKPNGK